MSFDLVLFGGTGDLTWRKLMPALFQAFRHGKLPEGGRILAVSRQELTDDAYRAWLKERFRKSKAPSGRATRSSLASPRCCTTCASISRKPSDYARLKDWLGAPIGRQTPADVVVMYLATSPDLFPVICAQLGAAGLNGPQRSRRAREAARPRPGERARDQPRRPLGVRARSRRSASTTTSASRRCRT